MSEHQITVLVMAPLVALFAWSVAAINGAVERGKYDINPAIGIRTSSTMHCEDCWRAGHHAAAGPLRRMLPPVLLLALAALAATLLESVSGPVPAYAMLAVGFSWIMAAMVAAAHKANAAARNLHPENQHPDAQLPR